ncbi:MAG: hypothetical protein GC138_06555 [Gammaproteobacteria bacterium]|nr:hypothetical protein [Gammaproteobacteria bacterium]
MDETPVDRYSRVFHRRLFIFIGLLLCYSAVGFYPYAWAPSETRFQNGAKIETPGLLTFDTPGIATSTLPSNWIDRVKSGQRFALDLTVNPIAPRVTESTTIFTVSAALTERNIAVEQDESGVLVWVRTSDNSSKGHPYFFGKVFEDKAWHHIHVMLSPGLLEIYIDGNRRLSERTSVSASDWSSFYRVALGNEQSGGRAWLGAMKKATVTVGEDAMDCLAGNTLSIPEQLTVKVGSVQSDWIPFSGAVTASSLLDWAINFFGFIPLGMTASLLVRRRNILVAVAVSAVASVGIEFGQLYIAVRTSQMDDILFNVGGGFIGGVIGGLVLSFKTNMKRM